MKRAVVLVLFASLSGVASAQVYDRHGYDPSTDDVYRARRGVQVDTARVVRVDPVFEGIDGYPGDRGDGRDPYRDGGYAVGGYGHDARCRSVRQDGDADAAGPPRDGWNSPGRGGYGGSTGGETGRTVATVIGGVLGAVVGSQVGGGSGRFATSAIGTMVGGIAGREVYEAGQRTRQQGQVTVCDPVEIDRDRHQARGGDSGRGISAYDVTYEYAGSEYTTRTPYHPGDTLRVRVDVTPYD